jgi:2-polyprenyl-3-methyl-5-hydroxy-6-metoxy-1,4-benzoquinol methylase
LYSSDLAYIHHAGFGDFAKRAAPEVIRILRRAGIRSGRIVDAGCGSGILSRHLVDAGYRVDGFDVSPAMVRLAAKNAPGAALRVASLTSVRLPPCRAVIAIGEVVAYASSVRAFLRRAGKAIEPGGLLIFDFVDSAARRTYPPKSIGGTDWALVVSADADRAGRILTRRITTFRKIGRVSRRSQEVHRVRIYRRAEMAQMLAAAGFRATMRRSYGGYRLKAGDVAVVAEKQ